MAAMAAPGVRLITAASDGDKKGVKKWLDQGVDVDSRDWDNLTPLIAASSQGHLVRNVDSSTAAKISPEQWEAYARPGFCRSTFSPTRRSSLVLLCLD